MRIPRPAEIIGLVNLLAGAALLAEAVILATGHPGWRWTFPSMTLAGSGSFMVLTGLAGLAFDRWLRIRLKTIKSASGDGDAN